MAIDEEKGWEEDGDREEEEIRVRKRKIEKWENYFVVKSYKYFIYFKQFEKCVISAFY